jgi:hypothetical protein
MGIVHFFCDESGKYQKDPVITISGVGADAQRLNRFDDEWNELLRSYDLLPELHMSRAFDLGQANGPKMPAGQDTGERIAALLPFADCINNHLEIGLVQAWDVKGYINLPMEVKRLLGGSLDPYQLAFIRGILEMTRLVGADGLINVVCDDNEVTAWDTYTHYRAIFKAVPESAKNFVGIGFAKSHTFNGLQAADMVAFLARREAGARFWGRPNNSKPLLDNLLSGSRSKVQAVMQWYSIFASEQDLINVANAVLAKSSASGGSATP